MFTSEHTETDGQSDKAINTLSGTLENKVQTSPAVCDKYLAERWLEIFAASMKALDELLSRLTLRKFSREQ